MQTNAKPSCPTKKLARSTPLASNTNIKYRLNVQLQQSATTVEDFQASPSDKLFLICEDHNCMSTLVEAGTEPAEMMTNSAEKCTTKRESCARALEMIGRTDSTTFRQTATLLIRPVLAEEQRTGKSEVRGESASLQVGKHKILRCRVASRVSTGKRGSQMALLLWSLVLYGLLQFATNQVFIHLPHLNHQQSAIDCNPTPSESAHFGCAEKFLTSSSNLPKISLLSSSTLPASHKLSSAYLRTLFGSIFSSSRRSDSFNIFGAKILLAEANSLYQPQQEREIIILNSTNFNTELIQHKNPFPHIKLIEYYVSFCGFCAKFKPTYTRLAKEIHPWRNVIRPSAIDLGVSTNSPIAHSWSVEVVPTLRIHPPPNPTLAEKLNKQLSLWSSKLTPSELQRSMFEEYNSSQLMIHSLGVAQYMDKIPLLKSDLVHYIERYVRSNNPTELPATWPNLKPVSELSLQELRRNHPRKELFLIIEGPASSVHSASSSDQSSSGSSSSSSASSSIVSELPGASLGLGIMLELSSSAAWRAVRYVRSSENRALIEDILEHYNKSSEKPELKIAQRKILSDIIANKPIEGNNVLLLHIDDSHSPTIEAHQSFPPSMFPLMTIVNSVDLPESSNGLVPARWLNSNDKTSISNNYYDTNARRARRDIVINHALARRSLFGPAESQTISTSRVDDVASYIKQTYTETSEDREFVRAINRLDADGEQLVATKQSAEDLQDNVLNQINNDKSSKASQQSSKSMKPIRSAEQESNLSSQEQSSVWMKLSNLFSSSAERKKRPLSYDHVSSDYEDKLKAIRYILFNEIPRTTMADKSLIEQQEKLNILVNLISVIKSYFPLPDLPSIRFIDGVQTYLLEQQSKLSTTIRLAGTIGFDVRAFKQELKRLELENEQLPEIKEWRHCKYGGYSCALWRLFHTLAAFEYKKLNQIRQPALLTSSSSSTGLQQSDNSSGNSMPAVDAISAESLSGIETNSSQVGPQSSPVEHLVSPSTTTTTTTTATSLSLTMVAPTSEETTATTNKPLTEADLPMPVLLVMRDYITNFFACIECRENFRTEAADLSLDKIRHQEPAEFSLIWLWETHNRVNKRLSVDPETNPKDHPKVWFPTYEQCATCYNKPPSFLLDSEAATNAITLFQEPIDWNRQEVLHFLLREYTKQPMDDHANIFGYQVPLGTGLLIISAILCLLSIVLLRCATYYIERQRRHKATLLNGNGAHYSIELQ